MAVLKLSAKTTETIEYLEALLKEADHFAALVELFASNKKGGDMYAAQMSRQLGQLRQKAMMRNLGFVADAAGQLGVMASRGGSPMMKARSLRDGVASFRALIERTIKGTAAADEGAQKEKAFLAEKAMKAQVEAVKARVLAEEAKEAAEHAAAAPIAPAAPATAGVVGKPAAARTTGTAPSGSPAPAAATKPSTVNPPAGPRFAAKPHVSKPPASAPAGPQPATTPATAAPAPQAKAPDSAPSPSAPAKPAAPEPVSTNPRE